MSNVSEKIVESSTYNLLGVYLSFGFAMFNTFFIARLLLPEKWAVIIITINLIYLCVFICNLFPPNAQDSIKYYIPHLTSIDIDEPNQKKRGFILHVYKIRLIGAGFVFLSYLIVAFIANFEKNLLIVILIMSPIVLVDILKNLNTSVLLAFQRFKKFFIINIIYPLIITIGFFLIFYYFPVKYDESTQNRITYLVAYIYLFGSILSCLISIFLMIPLLPSKRRNIEESIINNKGYFDVHKKYGAYLTTADVFMQLSSLIAFLLFINFDLLIFITWLTICEISVTSALHFSSSNPNAYISIFSEINYQKDPETFKSNFYQLNKFLMLFVCVIVGIMIFFVEIYIIVIYSERYLTIILFIQIYLFTTFSRIIVRNLFILTQSTNNTKINAQIAGIQTIFIIFSVTFALIFFSFTALIILFLFNSFLMIFFAVYLVNKKLDIKLSSLLFFKPFIIFLVSIIPVLLLAPFIYFEITPDFYLLNVFFNNAIKFFIFVIIFYVIFYFTKTLTKEEFDQLIEIIPILHSDNNFVKNIVNLIRKFLPSEKKKVL